MYLSYANQAKVNARAELASLLDTIQLPSFLEMKTRACLLDQECMDSVRMMMEEAFAPHLERVQILRACFEADDSCSFGIHAGGRLIGAYLVQAGAPMSVTAKLGEGLALEGIALVVHPEARGMGFGRALLELLPQVGKMQHCSYVWGGAAAELNNLDHWLRRRVLFESSKRGHLTIEPLTKDLKISLLSLATPSLREQWMIDLDMDQASKDATYTECPSP